MTRDRGLISKALDVLLPSWRAGELTSTAIVAYFYLVGISNEEGNGHVRYSDMQLDLGRGVKCCRDCVDSLRRNGLVDGANADGQGGAPFMLSALDRSFDGEKKVPKPLWGSVAGNVMTK